MGWLARRHGLSCDNVISFEVVTAQGKVVRASAEENSDLYWGLCGGGGNFGVVSLPSSDRHPQGWESAEDTQSGSRERRPDGA
jgi:hypothetical protein